MLECKGAWQLFNGNAEHETRPYGAKDHLSRREIVSTAPSRLLQVAAAAVCWRTAARPPAPFLQAVLRTQLCFFPYYFGALRWLGRSFVEVESSAPGALADAPDAVVLFQEAPGAPALVEVAPRT
mgnify:CR=1 FL=1